jgi:hypothetical protein
MYLVKKLITFACSFFMALPANHHCADLVAMFADTFESVRCRLEPI